jgi:hypothetical protein
MADASLDAAGHTGVAVAFFYETGALQFVYFVPATTTIAFQAEAAAMEVALREWQSPFFQKPKKIFSDCKQLVEFLKTGKNDQLPCWQGAREAFSCFQKLLSRRTVEPSLQICQVRREEIGLVHELANLARRSGRSYIGCPSYQELALWGVRPELLSTGLRTDRAAQECRRGFDGQLEQICSRGTPQPAFDRMTRGNLNPG